VWVFLVQERHIHVVPGSLLTTSALNKVNVQCLVVALVQRAHLVLLIDVNVTGPLLADHICRELEVPKGRG
jgi:hypothetical protein